jgi:hypothetical protein
LDKTLDVIENKFVDYVKYITYGESETTLKYGKKYKISNSKYAGLLTHESSANPVGNAQHYT